MKINLSKLTLLPFTSLLLLLTNLCLGAEKPLLSAKLADTATQLGWQEQPSSDNLCRGYYTESSLPMLILKPDFIQITAGFSKLRAEGRSELRNRVIITQMPNRQLIADKVFIFRNKSGNIYRTELYGNVQLQEPGKYIIGNKASVDLTAIKGHYYDALYRLTLDPLPYSLTHTSQQKRIISIKALTAHGHAKEIKQLSQGKLELEQATYTTCAPTTENWRLKAKKINLDHQTGRGIAHHALLTVKGVPVFYFPYFNFPIDKRRQSGFLFPLFGSSNSGGFNLGVPYYWNLAPNYDLTITPYYYSKRGLQFSHLFRYLNSASYGQFNYTLLPNDSAFASLQRSAPSQYKANPGLKDLITASNTRQYLSWQHFAQFSQHWSGAIDYTRVNDDYYLLDFNNIPATAIPNQLLQQGKINYADDHWSFQAMFQQFQTLHPVTLAAINNQYGRLPQLLLSGVFPDEKTGLIYQLNSELVHFWRPQNPGEIITPVAGDRIHFQPSVSLPFIGKAGFITPTLQFSLTQYNLSNQPNNYANSLFRSIPIVSVDSGLVFERNLSLSAHDFLQTLEPRAYYLYVPYREQYSLPLFDSGLQIFNYDQIFRNNRFTGIDRIGDANQITLALTTRLIDPDTGVEKFRASIGQIYYFRNRKVMLCDAKNCIDPLTTIGSTSASTHSSPITAQLSYLINPQWNALGNITWDPHTHSSQNGNFNFQYIPKANHIFNVGYNFIRYGDSLLNDNPDSRQNNLNQGTVSFSLPVRQNWQTVGGWTYNFSHDHSQSFFYGAEYNSCCWATRLVIAHTFIGLNSNNAPLFNKVIYLQLLLKGIGNIGTSDPSLIINTIPGYKDTFSQR